MAKWLRGLALAMGISCTAIGAYHMAGGIASVPGEEHAGATVDSRERFYNAIFAGYGLAWIVSALKRPVRARDVHALNGIFLLGGIGRLISLKQHGRPHWFQLPLTAIEVLLPAVFFRLADADEREAGVAVAESATSAEQ